MRPLALTLMLSASAALAACGGSTEPETVDPVVVAENDVVETVDTMTPAQMMVGEWNQETAFEMTSSEYGFTIMNGEVEYDADGTSEIEAMLIVNGLEDGENSYEIDLDGTYTLSGETLTERFTAAEVEPVTANDKTRTIAQAIEDALAGAGETTSTVVSIDETTLVRRVPGLGELRYSKDLD
ncbi:MAG: hypothetical protein WBF53_06230 [Litorimonas sp.]